MTSTGQRSSEHSECDVFYSRDLKQVLNSKTLVQGHRVSLSYCVFYVLICSIEVTQYKKVLILTHYIPLCFGKTPTFECGESCITSIALHTHTRGAATSKQKRVLVKLVVAPLQLVSVKVKLSL